jgi:hypothetical protein
MTRAHVLLLLLRTEAEECTTGRLLCGSRGQARAHPCRRRQRTETRAKARTAGAHPKGIVVVVVVAAVVAVGATAMSMSMTVSVPLRVSHRQDGERGKIRCATHGHRGSGRSREGWGGLVRSCTTADRGPGRRRRQRQSSRRRAEFTGPSTTA